MSVPYSQFKSDSIEGEVVWMPRGELSSPLDGSDMKQLTAIGGNNLFCDLFPGRLFCLD